MKVLIQTLPIPKIETPVGAKKVAPLLTFQQNKETLKRKICAQLAARVTHTRHVISQSVQTRSGIKLIAVAEQKSLPADIMYQNDHPLKGRDNYNI